jgi:aldose 1-epimerase
MMQNLSIRSGIFMGILFLGTLLAMAKGAEAKVTESVFGKTLDGQTVEIYTLRDGEIEARIMNYGARVVSLDVPDRNGKVADIVLGYDSFAPYLTDKAYFGALVGRYANRIAGGRFSLDGKQYQLSVNEGHNTLHGGKVGFASMLWQGHIVPDGVEFSLTSPDGDQGFPGKMEVRVRYTLSHGKLTIDYSAVTNKDTVVNLTNHSYFNLKGEGNGDILDHVLTIHADGYTASDAEFLPTGKIVPVEGTPLDFRKPTAVGARIGDKYEQLILSKGYDQNYVLDGAAGHLRKVARVYEPANGRVMTVSTTQPGMQLYSGNFLDGTITGKRGHIYKKHYGLCLETQHFPDSPNHANFPFTELKPGETFHSVTIYEFSTQH